jgi:hypothetical protein
MVLLPVARAPSSKNLFDFVSLTFRWITLHLFTHKMDKVQAELHDYYFLVPDLPVRELVY